jgi:hypothetical protein
LQLVYLSLHITDQDRKKSAARSRRNQSSTKQVLMRNESSIILNFYRMQVMERVDDTQPKR